MKAYIADVVALAQATAEEAGDAAEEVEAKPNTVKAEMAGLKGRMAESPLPYGGGFNTAYAPAGDTQVVTDASIALLPNDDPVEETDGIVHTPSCSALTSSCWIRRTATSRTHRGGSCSRWSSPSGPASWGCGRPAGQGVMSGAGPPTPKQEGGVW